MGTVRITISRCKPKFSKGHIDIADPMKYEEWAEYVNQNGSLTWFDTTKDGMEFYEDFGKNKLRHRTAFYDFDPTINESVIAVTWANEGYLESYVNLRNKKEKAAIVEIAEELGAKLYDFRKEIK